MSYISSSQKIVLSLGLAALASATLVTGASAFNFGGGHFGGGHIGGGHVAPMGGARISAAHFAPMGGNRFVANIRGPINHAPMHLPPAAFRTPVHVPIHFNPVGHGPWHLLPIGHGPSLPWHPVGHGPNLPWHPLPIPIGHGPLPWHPLPVPVGGPIIPVPVIDPVVPVPVPVPVDGGILPVAQPVGYVSQPVVTGTVATVPSCGISGTYVAITFLPTVTAADITTFLKAYNVTMADGPTVDGVYRIRLSTGAIAQSLIDQVITSMRTQTAIISTVAGA